MKISREFQQKTGRSLYVDEEQRDLLTVYADLRANYVMVENARPSRRTWGISHADTDAKTSMAAMSYDLVASWIWLLGANSLTCKSVGENYQCSNENPGKTTLGYGLPNSSFDGVTVRSTSSKLKINAIRFLVLRGLPTRLASHKAHGQE